MSGKFLQLNFKFNLPAAVYVDAVTPLADDFARVPGLLWKVWLMNEAASEAGGHLRRLHSPAARRAAIDGLAFKAPAAFSLHEWRAGAPSARAECFDNCVPA